MIKSISNIKTLDFDLPPELEASEPPEARGLARDEVRLMVPYRADNRVVHTQFRNIGDFLEPGDLLEINTSGTMNAAIHAHRADATALELHLSTPLPHHYVFPPAYCSVGFARHTLPSPSRQICGSWRCVYRAERRRGPSMMPELVRRFLCQAERRLRFTCLICMIV